LRFSKKAPSARRADQAGDDPVDGPGRHWGCKNIEEARVDITRLRSIISSLAQKNGLAIVAASTHPISRWQDQEIFDDERYELLVQELQTVARSLLIFGLHVHVGMADRERAIHHYERGPLFPAARAGADYFFAFLDGPQHRPQVLSHRNLKQFPRVRYSRSLRFLWQFSALWSSCSFKTKCIDNGRFWWDILPHPFFPRSSFDLRHSYARRRYDCDSCLVSGELSQNLIC